MEQLHAHEVLHMMEGNSYSESSLKEAIIQKFGEHQHFYTCSAEDMDADKLIEFLKAKGKFMPADDGFTVDITKVCIRLLRIKSVPSPCQVQVKVLLYGPDTDLVRTWQG